MEEVEEERVYIVLWAPDRLPQRGSEAVHALKPESSTSMVPHDWLAENDDIILIRDCSELSSELGERQR